MRITVLIWVLFLFVLDISGQSHPFSTEDKRATENTTDNLMDYNGGTKLKKYQWDQVHTPQTIISWMQDDGESAMLGDRITVNLQNEGITITYKGITGTLQSFGFNTKKEEVKFKVLKTLANPPNDLVTIQSIQNELDALFQRAANYLNQQL